LPEGGAVIRYGVPIGFALAPIAPGRWVHERLLRMPEARSLRDLPLATAPRPPLPPLEGYTFEGFRNADGTASNNLFGIKAGPSWKGAVAEVTTTEYVNGEARKVTAKFRAYASAAESFADYAKLMKTSPRYTGVVNSAGSAQGFAQGLQNAGYATDPAYADKLARTINTTLRLQRAMS